MPNYVWLVSFKFLNPHDYHMKSNVLSLAI